MTWRHLPPTAAPVLAADLVAGVTGAARSSDTLRVFEQEFADAQGVSRAWGVSSGRAALTVALRALRQLSARTSVVIPAFTCFSVPASIVRAGLNVVGCDIESATLDFDYEQLASMLERERPLAVVATHLFGLPCSVQRLHALCDRHGAFVIDDAAQALGTTVDGRPAGTTGHVGFYSFGRGKSVTCGSGGAIVTSSADIVTAIDREVAALDEPGSLQAATALAEAAVLAVFLRPSLYRIPASTPGLHLGETIYAVDFAMRRMSGAQAGLLTHWRLRLTEWNEARRENVSYFRRTVPALVPSRASTCIRLPIICESREARDWLVRVGRAERLGISLMYPTAVNGISELRETLGHYAFPSAERVAERLLTIPVHPWMGPRDRERVGELLSNQLATGTKAVTPHAHVTPLR
jgi:dTDP-4-amino-4,6-dideoxygalactose transaminase